MPKIQSYVSTQIYKKMTDIIDTLIEDGADRYEVNISSLAAKLIDMGMVMYELQNKTKDDSDKTDEAPEHSCEERIRLETLRSALRAELYSQGILQIAFDPNARAGSGDYQSYSEAVHIQVEDVIRKLTEE